MVAVLTIGLFFAGIPAYYDWLVDFAHPDLEPATVRANLEALGISIDFYAAYLLSITLASTMVWVAVAVVIFWRRSDDWMALFTSLGLLTFGAFTTAYGPIALAEQYPAVWLPVYLLGFLGSVSLCLFFYLFPNGRFVPRWTRWVVILWAAHEVAYYFFPDSIFNIYRLFPLLDFVTISTFLCVGIASQLYRYRRVSGPVQRQQTKWVVFGTVAAGLGMVGFTLPLKISPTLAQFGSPYAFALQTGIFCSTLLIPLSIGVAILRHRLWDVDAIINRTLVYGALSVAIVAVYVLVVGTLGTLFETHGSLPIAVLATGLVAVLFAPLRLRLQCGVNRLMYGERDDPYGVLSRLGQRLEATVAPGAVLLAIVETVAQALKLPYAAIALKRGDRFETAAAHGSPTGDSTVLPLVYQKETIGRLILSPRAPGEHFTPADRRLLEDLARNAEVAVHAVRLTADLQRSREQLVTAREEERRRLRRDLHDGLGPTLAGLTFGLDAARNLLGREPEDADALLAELKGQTQEAVSDVRRLVYGLRPPALDDLGLVPAIREQATSHGRLANGLPCGKEGEAGRENGLVFSVEVPEQLPLLPAAVEVACYRIAQEAMTNVARHARARSCRVRLSINEAENLLEVEIDDDGVGLPEDRRAGVGTISMCERAAELGGTCVVEPGPTSGTRVLARLPLPAKEHE